MNNPGFWASDEFDAALHLGTTYLAYGLRITDKSGQVRAFTNIRRTTQLPDFTVLIRPGRSVTIPATSYSAKGALRVTNLQKSDDASQTDNMEATLFFSSRLPESLVRAGALEGQPFTLIVYDWKTTADADGNARGILQLRGKLGERAIRGKEVTWKLRSLAHMLRTQVIEQTSRDSRARWGDPELLNLDPVGGISHDGFKFSQSATISEVDPDFPRSRFRLAGAQGYPDDRFADGIAFIKVIVAGASFTTQISVLMFDPLTGWFTLASDAPAPLLGLSVRAQVRAPRTLAEWLLYSPTARFAALEPDIPTFESANRSTPS